MLLRGGLAGEEPYGNSLVSWISQVSIFPRYRPCRIGNPSPEISISPNYTIDVSSKKYVADYILYRFFHRLPLVNDCFAYWYLFVCALIKGWLVSPTLLGDDFLQFIWMDPFLLMLRQSIYRCKDSQSINWFLRLFIVEIIYLYLWPISRENWYLTYPGDQTSSIRLFTGKTAPQHLEVEGFLRRSKITWWING